MPDSPAMTTHESALPLAKHLSKKSELALSAVRTLLGLVFIFWLLSLVPEKSDSRLSIPVTLLFVGLALYVVVLRWQLKRVVKAKRPELMATESIILSAALFIALFSAIYVIIEGNSPGSFSEPVNHFTASYFALTVLATVGFGDITAVSDVARFVVMLQMALGLGFIAVILKVFIATAQRVRQQREPNAPESQPAKDRSDG